jgi:hypothetical protein
MSTRHVVSANLKALMESRPKLDTLKKITAESDGKLSNGKLDRIRRATHATDIDTLGELAEVFGLQPWQLLVPDLNPKALPQIAGAELLTTIRALLTAESTTATVEHAEPAQSGKKKGLGRLPGEIDLRAGRAKGKTGAVNQPGAIPRKRSR